jgi:hypothetical protein
VRLNGRIPHMIINRLDRSRLDANRPMEDAAQVLSPLSSHHVPILMRLPVC